MFAQILSAILGRERSNYQLNTYKNLIAFAWAAAHSILSDWDPKGITFAGISKPLSPDEQRTHAAGLANKLAIVTTAVIKAGAFDVAENDPTTN